MTTTGGPKRAVPDDDASGAPRWLLLAATLSLLFAATWIVMNTPVRAFALGLGRPESAAGAWHFILGEEDEATRWFERSLDAYPRDFIASYDLGESAMERGDFAAAVGHYAASVRARPHHHNYRARLVEALIRSGRPEPARRHLDTLRAGDPGRADFSFACGIAWLELGRPDSAATHLTRALALAPGDTAMVALARRLRTTDDPRQVVREAWSGLRVN